MLLNAIITAAAACPAVDPRVELLAIHESARTAHLTGDAGLIAASADANVIMADGGSVRKQTAEQVRSFFSGYFQRVRYSQWSDQRPPEIAISPDGQIGWMAVAINARLSPTGQPQAIRSFRSSWIATYRKVGCAWKMTGIASNIEE